MAVKYATAVTVATLALLATSALAQTVYRYKDSQGNTVYTDKPPAGNGTVQRLEIPPQPPQPVQPAAGGQSDAEKKLLEAANRRTADLDRAAEDVVTAFNALRAAEARRDEGVELQEGDRSGRYLSRQYFQRRQALELDVRAAQAQLDEALARRNALR
ncbi:MAG TPA: DUF4124 domain-containing protein [Burkholderiales bacterium]|nr:DUF4124 domain-containing protein [Burkholderiales bacterium]